MWMFAQTWCRESVRSDVFTVNRGPNEEHSDGFSYLRWSPAVPNDGGTLLNSPAVCLQSSRRSLLSTRWFSGTHGSLSSSVCASRLVSCPLKEAMTCSWKHRRMKPLNHKRNVFALREKGKMFVAPAAFLFPTMHQNILYILIFYIYFFYIFTFQPPKESSPNICCFPVLDSVYFVFSSTLLTRQREIPSSFSLFYLLSSFSLVMLFFPLREWSGD